MMQDTNPLANLRKRAEQILQDQPDRVKDLFKDMETYLAELERQNQALQQAEEQLAHQAELLQTVSDAIISTDLDFNITSWNQAAKALYGWRAEEVLGKPVADVTHLAFPHHRQEQVVAEFMAQGYWEGEFTQQCKDGKTRHIYGKITLIRNPDGDPIGAVAINRDITARRQAEEALRRSEANLRAMLDSAWQSYTLIDRAYRVVDADKKGKQAAIDIFGKAMQPGASIYDFVREGDIESFTENFERALNGEAVVIEKKLQNSQGAVYYYEVRYYPVADNVGEIIGVCMSNENITARKQAEETVRKSEARYRILARNFPNGMVALFDHDLRYIVADGTELRKIGLSSEDFAGKKLSDLFSPEVYERDEPALLAALRGEAQTNEVAYGNQIYRVHTLPVHDDHDEIVAGMVMTQNITEHKQLVGDLEAFAYMVAHDLKSPLTVIAGFAEMLVEAHQTIIPEKINHYGERITQSANHMKRIIQELLLLASVREMENVPLVPLDMGQIIDDALDRLEFVLKKHEAQINTLATGAWPVALGYAPWIEEIWTNYISNAAKYGAKPGETPCIELGAEVQGEQVHFWVRDHGPGIPEESLPGLFNQFTQLNTNTEGHGMGLSVVRRIAEKLGGQVNVTSTVGEGSRFGFTLPLVDDQSNAPYP